MSQPRILRTEADSYYHAYSRIVDKQMVIGDAEKAFFASWMRRLETFCGVEVVTFCLMSNHFHLLVRVPRKASTPTLDEATLRTLLPVIYSEQQLQDALQELDAACAAAEAGSALRLKEVLMRYQARRYDLSSFVKDLKHRFTRWFNARHDRVGTLWEDKFHSVLVEGSENALLTVAAYIDLNPVRASLVDDPKDYRWCGYGEAVADRAVARRGLGMILQHTGFGINRTVTWKRTSARYRMLLYDHGQARDADTRTGATARSGFSREQLDKENQRGGILPPADVLRCKIRYFTDGGIVGSESFVDKVFAEQLATPNTSRQKGARKMAGADWGELRVLRALQKRPIG